MSWTSDRCYLAGLDFFDERVRATPAEGWAKPSPCAGWRALDVLGHVGMVTDLGTRLLRGEEITLNPSDDPPGDAITGDPGAYWAALVEPARAAVEGADLTLVVDSPMGRRSVADSLSFPAIDLFVHGWDLAAATGRRVDVPIEAIEFAHAVLGSLPEQMVRSERVFGSAVELPADASRSDVFIAWTGRDPSWHGA